MQDHVTYVMQDQAKRSLQAGKQTSSPSKPQDAVGFDARLIRDAFNQKLVGLTLGVALAGAFLVMPVAFAHSPSSHGQMPSSMPHGMSHGATNPTQQPLSQEQYAWGKMGQAGDVARDIEISMTDNMRFSPDKLTVKLGETIRFVIRNDGKILHEFVLGTPEELQKHAELMEKFPNMVHDEPYMAHVDPGQQGAVIWQFNRAGEFDFACLLPGHFQAGMVGKILVE